jgi:hypothetical protein
MTSQNPFYNEALSDRVKYAKYFTYGDSEGDVIAYKMLNEHDLNNNTRLVQKFGKIVAEIRTYIHILQHDVIEDKPKITNSFKAHVRQLLWEDAKLKVIGLIEAKPYHTWMLNCLKKASQLDNKNNNI